MKDEVLAQSQRFALSDALGTTPEFWLSLQQQHDLWYSAQAHERIERLA